MCNFFTTLTLAATTPLPIYCVALIQSVSIGNSVTALTSKSFSWCVTAFILEWKSVSIYVCVGRNRAVGGGWFFHYDRGEHWLVWCWTSEEARHPPRLSVNVQLTFEEVAMGEGTTDLRIFAGHKVTHSVSTQSASQSNSSQARDHGVPR